MTVTTRHSGNSMDARWQAAKEGQHVTTAEFLHLFREEGPVSAASCVLRDWSQGRALIALFESGPAWFLKVVST